MSQRDAILKSWRDNAAAWTRVVREGCIESRRLGTDAAVIDAVLAYDPKAVLDAGCGEGWLARALAERGIEVTAFDASPALIERATEAGNSVRFLQCGYDEFAASPTSIGDQFDVVVFNFSLFEEDISAVLRAAHRVLRSGGIVIVQTIHPFNDAVDAAYADGWREEKFDKMPGDFRTAMPWYFRTMGSWLSVVRGAGFTIEEVREPFNSQTGKPLSLLIVGGRA